MAAPFLPDGLATRAAPTPFMSPTAAIVTSPRCSSGIGAGVGIGRGSGVGVGTYVSAEKDTRGEEAPAAGGTDAEASASPRASVTTTERSAPGRRPWAG